MSFASHDDEQLVASTRERGRAFRVAAGISFVLLVVSIAAAIASVWARPQEHHLSIGRFAPLAFFAVLPAIALIRRQRQVKATNAQR